MIENTGIKRKLTDIGIGTNTEIDESSTAALYTEHLYNQDAEYHKATITPSQNHPLCLIVQAILFLFFYLLKRALTCKRSFDYAGYRVELF